jgi:hypothetical protein
MCPQFPCNCHSPRLGSVKLDFLFLCTHNVGSKKHNNNNNMDNAELNDEIEALEAIFCNDLKGVLVFECSDTRSGWRPVNNGTHVTACAR